MVQLNPVAERSGEVELQITDYRLPNGSIKVERPVALPKLSSGISSKI
jgi:hypothetical protein